MYFSGFTRPFISHESVLKVLRECACCECVCACVFLVTGLTDLPWSVAQNALHFLGCSSSSTRSRVQIYCIQLSCDFHKKLLCLENFSSLLKQQNFCSFAPFDSSFRCPFYAHYFLSFLLLPLLFCSLLSLFLSFAKRIYCQKSSSGGLK